MKNILTTIKKDVSSAAMIAVGSILWSLTMVKSGLMYSFGLGFWGPNGHDGVWHIALTESLKRLTLANPVMSGVELKNYHIGFDVLVAFLSKLTFIPTSFLYFQILPPIFSLILGILVFRLVKLWGKGKVNPFYSLFFIYLGGGFGFLVHLIRYSKLGGDSMFWAQSQATTLINPPFVLSLIFLLFGLIYLTKVLEKGGSKNILITVLSFILAGQIKIYAGILMIFGLFGLSIIRFISQRKSDAFRIFLLVFVFTVVLFLPLNRSSGKILEFYPFWFLETMMAYGDRVNWDHFHNAMVNYRLAHDILKGFLAYSLAFLIFFVGNLGTRILFIKTYFYKKVGIINDPILIFLTIVSFFGFLIPMFVIQKGTPWNTIQFFYYTQFFLGIVAGVSFYRLIGSKRLNQKIIYIVLLFLFTIPTTVTTMGHYLPATPPAKISKTELEALKILREKPLGTILSLQIPGREYSQNEAPRPLYNYDSTAYLSAFTNKPVFLEDLVNLNIMDYNWPERLEIIKQFMANPNSDDGKTFLRENNIRYIYFVKGMKSIGLHEPTLGLTNIYDSIEVIVYEVN